MEIFGYYFAFLIDYIRITDKDYGFISLGIRVLLTCLYRVFC
jgi:hypothetical protein